MTTYKKQKFVFSVLARKFVSFYICQQFTLTSIATLMESDSIKVIQSDPSICVWDGTQSINKSVWMDGRCDIE